MITLYDIYRLNWQEVIHTTSKTLCKCQCFLGVTFIRTCPSLCWGRILVCSLFDPPLYLCPRQHLMGSSLARDSSAH